METTWARPETSSGKFHAMTEADDAFTRLCTGVPEAGDLATAPDDLEDGQRCGNCVKKLGQVEDGAPAPVAASDQVMASFVMGGPLFLHAPARIRARKEGDLLDLEVPAVQGRPRILLDDCPRCDEVRGTAKFRWPSWTALEAPAESEEG